MAVSDPVAAADPLAAADPSRGLDALDPGPVLAPLGRVAGLLALASAVVHVLLLDTASLGSLVMAGAALACLPCAWHLWHRATARVWGATAAVDGAMLLLHGQMLGAAQATAMPGMPHGSGTTALMWLGLGLVLTQLAAAGTAALHR